MAETDSFIDEVSEEVRKDKLYGFLRRWGWLIALVLLLIVGGAGFNEWRKHQAEQSARAAGDALRTALLTDDPAQRAEALAPLAEGDGEARVVAALARAGALLQSGEDGAAAELLTALGNDAAVGEPYKSLANLQRLMILGDELPVSERLAALEILTYLDAPFRPLALEQRALVHIEQGNTEAALEDLEAVLTSPLASDGLRGRAQQLIIAVGGALPLEGSVPEADG